MRTEVTVVNPVSPEPAPIERAAAILRAGQVVAFPTETVYGLGANAMDFEAVERIFEAKGRPACNPIIVHVADSSAARDVVAEWSQEAQRLSDRFWPGPLTMVLAKSSLIPSNVTAGGDTVGVRSPNHGIALALIRTAGVPIAAPSANRSSEVSPTRADHVLKSLGGRIPLILDGGICSGGIESTVLDLTERPFRILRPGAITASELQSEIGQVIQTSPESIGTAKRSPGQMARHYAPRARLEICTGDPGERIQALLGEGVRIAWLKLSGSSVAPNRRLRVVDMPSDHREYASLLYAALHELDEEGVDVILVSLPQESEKWRAIRDRLTRAAVNETQPTSNP